MNSTNCLESMKTTAAVILDMIQELEHQLESLPDPYSLSEERARNEAFDLSDAYLDLRNIRDLCSSISSRIKNTNDGTGIQRVIERRMNALMVVAGISLVERQGMKVRPRTTNNWYALNGTADEKLHEELRKVGLGDIVDTKVNTLTLRSAVDEYIKLNGSLPKSLEDQLGKKPVPSVTAGKA